MTKPPPVRVNGYSVRDTGEYCRCHETPQRIFIVDETAQAHGVGELHSIVKNTKRKMR